MKYKREIERKATSALYGRSEEERAAQGVGGASLREDAEVASERVRQLSSSTEARRVVFQSVAVTGLQLLHSILQRDRQALAAAISLGQREKLENMIGALETLSETLKQSLSQQGAQMLDLCAAADEKNGAATLETDEDSWWFALTEALESIEGGIEQMDSLADGQPEESAPHRLSDLMAEVLRRQHKELLREAQQWIA
ncbi:MAG: hypothetical protein BRD44_01505 [Bacteroidetes bacterium QS_7_67_15]|nr:MAG: hypothetical protein BRD44_01505 [Bacteroidetes bacterium QS_7_67_15]PSQ98392.1 MAG: hypothetical protein BRD48_07365 [Bacteroidetes bacterium QS_9_68_14]